MERTSIVGPCGRGVKAEIVHAGAEPRLTLDLDLPSAFPSSHRTSSLTSSSRGTESLGVDRSWIMPELIAGPKFVRRIGRDLTLVEPLDGPGQVASSGADAIEYERCAW